MTAPRIRHYGMPHLTPPLTDMDLRAFSLQEFEVGEKHSKGLAGRRFIARKDGDDITFQINEGTKDEPKLRNPTVDELKAGYTALNIEMNTLSREGEENHAGSGYNTAEERRRIRALNEVVDTLGRRTYAGMGVDYGPIERALTLEDGGRTIRAVGRKADSEAFVEARDSGGEWRPAGKAEREKIISHIKEKMGGISGEWKDHLRLLLESIQDVPAVEEPLRDVHHPTEVHFDAPNASFRFFEPVEDAKKRFGPPGGGDVKYHKGFGFQLQPLAHMRRDTSKYPDKYTPPLCGFYVKEPLSEWAPAKLPDMEKMRDKMVEFKKSLADKPDALHRMEYMIRAASDEIQRMTKEKGG